MSRFGVVIVILLGFGITGAAADDKVARGAYLIRAAGCVGCHTDTKGGGAPLAGGRGLKTPFGVFYSPNITPHSETGIERGANRIFLMPCAMAGARAAATTFRSFPTPVITPCGRKMPWPSKPICSPWLPSSARTRPMTLPRRFLVAGPLVCGNGCFLRQGPGWTGPSGMLHGTVEVIWGMP